MASQTLKQRAKDEPAPPATGNNIRNRRAQKMAMARRGLKSLAVGLTVPVSATILSIYLFGVCQSYLQTARPFWYPPSWVFHLASLCTSCLMALSGWLIWAEGGFHEPKVIALPLYVAQLVLSLAWAPIVFALNAPHLGLAVCVALLLSLYACSTIFKRVNPIAGDLVTPCLAWAAFLVLMNYWLL